MSVTTTPRLGVHQWSAGTDPFTRAQLNASLLALENNAAMYSSGADLNARPAAGKAGRLFLDQSVGVVWYDTGTTWVAVTAFGAMTHRAAAGQTDPLIKYANAAGAEVAQIATTGAGRFRSAASLLARSSVETGVINATDSRVTLGSAGTSGSAGDTPAIDLLRAASGSSGQAWRISAPSATGPLEIGGSDSGTAAWGSENILPRLKIGRPSSMSDHALTVRGVAGQSGEMLRCENGSGTTIASIYANGGAYLTSSLACSAVNATGQVQGANLNATSTTTASTIAGPLTVGGQTTAQAVSAASVATSGNVTVGGNLTVTGTISPSQTVTPRYASIHMTSNYNLTTNYTDEVMGASSWTLSAFSGAGFNAATNQITVTESGYYQVSAQIFVFNNGSAYPCMLKLKDANLNTLLFGRGYIPNGQNCTVTMTKMINLSSASSYKLYAQGTTSMSISLGQENSFITLTKVA